MWTAALSDQKLDGTTFDISPTIAESFSLLKERLEILEATLSPNLFAKLWRRIASLLNDYIFDQITTKHYFAVGSASQFAHDIRAMLLIFKPYTSHPENFFKEYVFRYHL
jgi:hypothetical protein